MPQNLINYLRKCTKSLIDSWNQKKLLNYESLVNESCDFSKKFTLQFHKFSHQIKMLQIHIQKVNEKPQNWQCVTLHCIGGTEGLEIRGLVLNNAKTKLDILSNYCGPLKMSELYMDAPLTRIGKGHASVTARLAE